MNADDLFIREPMSLIVSLPQNDAALACAAVNGGADALKVHINVHHDASGTHFGSFGEEKKRLAAILTAVDVPVGIVPGDTVVASPDDMSALAEMGFTFFDMYADAMPAWMLADSGMTAMVAARHDTPPEQLEYWVELGMEVLEAAVIRHEDYGAPLTVADLGRYCDLAAAVDVPVVVPTQKRIMTSDLALLLTTGIDAVMIGAIVTGSSPDSIERTIREFRTAIDELD